MDSTTDNAMAIDLDVAMDKDLYPEVKPWALQMCTPFINAMVSWTIHVVLQEIVFLVIALVRAHAIQKLAALRDENSQNYICLPNRWLSKQ